MTNELDPLVGQWYFHTDKGQRFTVTAMDEADNTVEVQHFDGDIEEYNLNEWRELSIELSEAPENWGGALDVSELDDLGTEITDTKLQDWEEPQQDFRAAEQEKPNLETEPPVDDYGEGYMEEKPQE